MSISKRWVLLGFFILLKFMLQYTLIGAEYDLHRDEFLHLDQAHHLAWGYLSLPPFTSWVAWIILQLGNSVFWVKFFPALFGTLTLVVVWKTVEALDGNLFALIMASVSIIFSALLRLNILFQPNSADILFWTLLYFSLVKYIKSENHKWLWMAGLVFGFGFLNKYNIAFLLLGLLPALLITEQRKIFLQPKLYWALGLALLIILPNLVWQYQNEFPVFHHMRILVQTQLVNMERSAFVKEQFLFFFSSFFILICAFVGFFLYKPYVQYRVFFWSFVFTFCLFVYLHAKGYYAIGLYPILIAFGSVYLESLLQKGWLRYLKPVAIIIPVVLFIPVIKIAFPIESPEQIKQNGARFKRLGLLRWEDGKDHILPQDFADMLGWKELATKVDQACDSVPNQTSLIVICDNYGQAGAINYYSKHKNIQAVSMNADYINWFPLERDIKNVILVTEAGDDDIERKKERSWFNAVYLTGQIENPYAREVGTHVFLLRDSKVSLNSIIQAEINKSKKGQTD